MYPLLDVTKKEKENWTQRAGGTMNIAITKSFGKTNNENRITKEANILRLILLSNYFAAQS